MGAPPDVDGFARAMAAYLMDPARRASEGAAARAHIECHFDARNHGRAIEREIVHVIETAHASARHAA